MHWLMVGFVASLVALLVVAASAALHIRLQHAKHRRQELARLDPAPDGDLEPEP